MINISKSDEIKSSLSKLFEYARKNKEMNEETLRTKFYSEGILGVLGYSDEGIHLEERLTTGKRTDIRCTDEFGNVRFVIEFKKPKIKNLKNFKTDLWKKYVSPLKADYGVLYNGLELILYQRKRNELIRVLRTSTEEMSKEKISKLISALERPDYNTTDIKKVTEYFSKFRSPEERLILEHESSLQHFYESFKLVEGSTFEELVSQTVQLFEKERKSSDFLDSAYEFWKRSYAKELTKSQVPDDWKPLFKKAGLSTGKKEDRYKLTFCLETAYALFTRLILTKSCEDYGFPDANFSEFLQNEVNQASRGGDIAQSAWPKIALEIIRDMRGKLVSSVFEEDIFYWWTEPFETRRYHEFFKDRPIGPSEEMSRFGRSVARILLSTYKFDFSRIGGDPLGKLYQQYFDKETRKALGEFYTPREVVEYILDSIGYKGRTILNKKLLDPACGSGTFLVGALERYLKAAEKKAQQEGWPKVLEDLCNRYRIVGFDIHPFATIMAQTQFTLVLLPKYKKAREENSQFLLKRLPIFRTDSLEKERERGEITLEEAGKGKVFSMPVELPIREKEEGEFFEEKFQLPFKDAVIENTDINNLQEYFGAIQAVFDAVKETAEQEKYEIDTKLLEIRLQEYLTQKQWSLLAEFFQGYANDLLNQIKQLKHEFEDGRLVKSIEDVLLAALLKNYVSYDCVVGNPPYVRIQDLPEKQKKKWGDSYEYAKGNYDIYIPFIERGINWLDSDGKLSYIVSNRFLLVNYGEPMREKLPQEAAIDKLVDLRDSRVFKDALNYPSIFVFSNRETKEDYFPVARVFKDIEDGEKLLNEIDDNLNQLKDADDHKVGKHSDAFYVKYSDLTRQGWHLMPPEERKVFEKITDQASGRLFDFTKSKSGGFAGYQTSKDPLYVLSLIEERKNTIVACPKGGGDPVEIEKDLVRPFLFGKDVKRWNIDWKGWYVIFPYKKYVIDGKEKYRLIPSKKYQEKFDYGDEYIEDLYPKGWKYLKSIENELRSRESGKFKEGRNKEHKWYGAGYPRNKEKFDEDKIVAQLNSKEADFAVDAGSRYVFQAGGKGGGVYGVLPDQEKISIQLLAGLLNSRILDFYLKHVSTVYAGKSYSYADAFIKLLPIKISKSKDKKKKSKEIASLTKQLGDIASLKRRIRMFPVPYFSDLRKEGEIKEWDEIRHVTKRGYSPLSVDRQSDLEGNEKIRLGKDDVIESYKIDSEEKLEYVIQAIDGKKFSKREEILIRLPVANDKVKKILEALEADKKKLEKESEVEELEEKANNLIYDLYNLSKEEQGTVEDFLGKF